MKIMRFFIKGLILLSLLLVFSCGTTRKLKKDDSQAVSSAVVDYGRKVMKKN